MTDDAIREYYENGQVKYEELPDGSIRIWYKSGQLWDCFGHG